MSTPIDRQWRRLAAPIVLTGVTAIAMVALFAAAPPGPGAVAPGAVRLVDQVTDLPAQPPTVVLPPGTALPPGVVMLPGGLPMPPLPPGFVLPPEVPQMLMQGQQMLASPPPNVPNEVCRFNTVRVPCP